MTDNTPDALDGILTRLIDEVSSIQAGKTFVPADYIEPAKTALLAWAEGLIPEEKHRNHKPFVTTNGLLSMGGDHYYEAGWNAAIEEMREKLK